MPGDGLPQERPPILKIETIKAPKGSEASYCRERGGIITSLKFHGAEVLYMDEATLRDPKASVKGGVPILFPNAGPLPEGSQFPNLKQHGFARDSNKWVSDQQGSTFIESLASSPDTKNLFPYDFLLSVSGQFNPDGSFEIHQSMGNTEESKEVPVSMGLHPYFQVPGGDKEAIKFNFPGGDIIEKSIKSWSNGEPIKAIKIDNPNAVMEVVIPGLGTLFLEASPEYKRIWVWSMVGKDFICVEPVMRDAGGLVNDPEKVKPGATINATFKINAKIKQGGRSKVYP